MTSGQRAPLTMQQQAELVEYMIGRCRRFNGATSRETWMLVTEEQVADLEHLAARLKRMAPHEGEIKRVVMRK